jgi:hypothetical protein
MLPQDSNLRGRPEPDRRAPRAIAAITWQRPVLQILGKRPMAPDGITTPWGRVAA